METFQGWSLGFTGQEEVVANEMLRESHWVGFLEVQQISCDYEDETHTYIHTHTARSKEEIKGKERRRDGRGEKTRKEGRRGEGKERKRKRKIHFSNQKNLKLNVALYFQG